MKLCKLTNSKGQTMDNTQWGRGVTNVADGQSTELCNKHWVHGYRDAYVALLVAPIHVCYTRLQLWQPGGEKEWRLADRSQLWDAEGEIGLEYADKCGCTILTTIRRIRKPRITLAMRREFARLVALEVYPLWEKYDKDHVAGNWLKHPKRGRAAAAAARAKAAWVVVDKATAAERMAARAAEMAAKAREGEDVEWVTLAAAIAAGAAAEAARWMPATTLTPQRMVEIAHEACGVTT